MSIPFDISLCFGNGNDGTVVHNATQRLVCVHNMLHRYMSSLILSSSLNSHTLIRRIDTLHCTDAIFSCTAEEQIEEKKEERKRKGQDPDWSVILNRTASPPLLVCWTLQKQNFRLCLPSCCAEDDVGRIIFDTQPISLTHTAISYNSLSCTLPS